MEAQQTRLVEALCAHTGFCPGLVEQLYMALGLMGLNGLIIGIIGTMLALRRRCSRQSARGAG